MTKRYIHRKIEKQLLSAIDQFPVLTLTGPRQTGKTTLLRKLFPDYKYVSFDDPVQRTLAFDDPELLLDAQKLIIDEVQYLPQIIPYIKIRIDNNRSENGQVILTGSQIFPLMSGLTESLAGRTVLFELLGLSFVEFVDEMIISRDDCFNYIFNGFYPDPLVHNVNRVMYYSSYLQTYLERDIRQVTSVQDLKIFQEFLELLATRVASVLNLSEAAKECGISIMTAKRWLNLLEITKIVYLLRPFHKNITKRVIKSPKLYFTDTGLLAYILRYPDKNVISTGKIAGMFFENMIISEILKYKYNNLSLFELYFYRDSHHNEIDIVLDYGVETKLIELKASNTIKTGYSSTIGNYSELFKNPSGYVLSFSSENIKLSRSATAIPWYKLYDLL